VVGERAVVHRQPVVFVLSDGDATGRELVRCLSEKARAVPGVKSAAFTAVGILEGNEWDSTVTVEGYAAKPGEDMNPYCNAASPGYFGTMGMRLMLGRDFDTRDERFNLPVTTDFGDTYRVAIANEKFAKKYFGDANPIGRHIGFGGDPGTKTPIEIVGIVKDAKYVFTTRPNSRTATVVAVT
jgi:hypothetical protein